MRALITGASGFVGSRLAEKLSRAGWHVEVLLRPGSAEAPRSANRIHRTEPGDAEGLRVAVEQAAPDVVFHLASCFIAEHQPDQVLSLIRSNIEFGALLLEAMASAGVKRLVTAGTSWQHFHSETYKPVCLYAATKEAFSALLAYYVDACGFRAVTLKLFDTYGPEDPRKKLMHLLERTARTGTPVAFSPGEQIVDLLHIDDATAGFLAAAERLLADKVTGHEQYALGSGERIRLRDLIALYERCCGRQLPIELGARPYRAREVMVPWLGGAELPGWQARISLEAGIRELVAEAAVAAVAAAALETCAA